MSFPPLASGGFVFQAQNWRRQTLGESSITYTCCRPPSSKASMETWVINLVKLPSSQNFISALRLRRDGRVRRGGHWPTFLRSCLRYEWFRAGKKHSIACLQTNASPLLSQPPTPGSSTTEFCVAIQQIELSVFLNRDRNSQHPKITKGALQGGNRNLHITNGWVVYAGRKLHISAREGSSCRLSARLPGTCSATDIGQLRWKTFEEYCDHGTGCCRRKFGDCVHFVERNVLRKILGWCLRMIRGGFITGK